MKYAVRQNTFTTSLLGEVLMILAKGEPLPEKYLDHPLKGGSILAAGSAILPAIGFDI